MLAIFLGIGVFWCMYYLFNRKSESPEKISHHQEPISDRMYSRNQIRSQLPYTKNGHFWLVDRSDGSRNSIEIIQNKFDKVLKIRYWRRNRIDGIEITFDRKIMVATVKYYDFGKQIDVENEEAEVMFECAQNLFEFYCDSSPYVKNLGLNEWFDG